MDPCEAGRLCAHASQLLSMGYCSSTTLTGSAYYDDEDKRAPDGKSKSRKTGNAYYDDEGKFAPDGKSKSCKMGSTYYDDDGE